MAERMIRASNTTNTALVDNGSQHDHGRASSAGYLDDDDDDGAARVFLHRHGANHTNRNDTAHDNNNNNNDDDAVIFSPHPSRRTAVALVSDGHDGSHDGTPTNGNDRSHHQRHQHQQSHQHQRSRKKKKNSLGLFKFLGSAAAGASESGGASSHSDADVDDALAVTNKASSHHQLPIPLASAPAVTMMMNAAPIDMAESLATPAASHQPSRHHQQPVAAKKLLLLNLEDVSILSSSVISGSHRTPYDESRTATATTTTNTNTVTGSETQLSMDAQQVLGGLRKQRESREERKRAVLLQQQAAAASSSMHSSSHHHKKKGSMAAASKNIKSKSAKKNGINPDAMLGTVLVVPCGGGPLVDIEDDDIDDDDMGGVEEELNEDLDDDDEFDDTAQNEADVAAERATACWFPKKDMAADEADKPTSTKAMAMVTSNPCSSSRNVDVEAPASPPRKKIMGGTTSAKKPSFVAPPPLMEDWSDNTDSNNPDDQGAATATELMVTDRATSPTVGSDVHHHGSLGVGEAAAVLRDYRRSLLSDDDSTKDTERQEPWMVPDHMKYGTSSSPKDVRHVFVKSESESATAAAAKIRIEEESKQEEEDDYDNEDALLSSQQVPKIDTTSTSSQFSTHSSTPPVPPTLLRAISSWGPYTFPSTRSLEAQFREQDIAVAPNVRLPVRGVKETMAALRRVDDQPSNFVTTKCWTCEAYLCCLRDAEFVLCPSCRVVSPLETVTNDEYEHQSSGYGASKSGVALGFTDSEWLQWRQQISLYEEGY